MTATPRVKSQGLEGMRLHSRRRRRWVGELSAVVIALSMPAFLWEPVQQKASNLPSSSQTITRVVPGAITTATGRTYRLGPTATVRFPQGWSFTTVLNHHVPLQATVLFRETIGGRVLVERIDVQRPSVARTATEGETAS